MPDENKELSVAFELVLRLIRDEYPLAKQAVIELEVFSGSRSKKAVYELRDFLDHLSEMLSETDQHKIQEHAMRRVPICGDVLSNQWSTWLKNNL